MIHVCAFCSLGQGKRQPPKIVFSHAYSFVQ
jgi:hypothetical protein